MPMMKADRKVTAETRIGSWTPTFLRRRPTGRIQRLDDPRTTDRRADDQGRADDDDDVVAEAAERVFDRNDAACQGRQQRCQGDQVVTEPTPDEQRHRTADDGEGQALMDIHTLQRWLDAIASTMRARRAQ